MWEIHMTHVKSDLDLDPSLTLVERDPVRQGLAEFGGDDGVLGEAPVPVHANAGPGAGRGAVLHPPVRAEFASVARRVGVHAHAHAHANAAGGGGVTPAAGHHARELVAQRHGVWVLLAVLALSAADRVLCIALPLIRFHFTLFYFVVVAAATVVIVVVVVAAAA